MKILTLGPYANLHFLSKKLLEEPTVDKVYHMPAIFQPTGRYEPIKLGGQGGLDDRDDIIKFINTTELDLVVINALALLQDQRIQDALTDRQIPKVGCTKELTKLEWSKLTGKKLLKQLDIPTPNHTSFTRNDLLNSFLDIPRPWVLKYEQDWRVGLQTIIITDDNYQQEFEDFKKYGANKFVDLNTKEESVFLVEDYIQIKKEYSYHILANSKGWTYLGSARDYKKFDNGDKGFNTAGMGSYSKVNINPKVHDYADKLVKHFNETSPYVGILYLGIAEDDEGRPYVLEINTRGGCTELQSILLTHNPKQSLSQILYQTATNKVIDPIQFSDSSAVSVRIVRKNYREVVNYYTERNLKAIGKHLDPDFYPEVPGIYITAGLNRHILNSVISTKADTKEQASDSIYKFLSNKNLYNFTYRTDIGYLE